MNEKAASSQRAEYQFMSERNQQERTTDGTSTSLQAVSTTQNQQPNISSLKSQLRSSTSNLAVMSHVEEECMRCLEVVHKKMVWARSVLENEQDPNVATSYLKTITSCVEALTALRKFSQ